jgi:hypothetical protein
MPSSGPRWLCLTCNPTSNWFYRRIIKPLHLYLQKGTITENLLIDIDTQKPIIELFEGPTYDNEANLPPDFIKGIESTFTGQMRDRFLLGKWAAYEGLVHPGFREEIHFLSKDFILNYLDTLVHGKRVEVKAIEGYDFGISSPSCYLLGFIDDYGRVFILDGFYEKEMSLERQSEAIKFLRARYSHLLRFGDPICADPSLFRRKTMPGYKILGTTIASKFDSDYGIKMRPGDNTIEAGIIKVNSYLNQYAHLPSIVPPEKSSLLYFSDELGFVRDEFGNYFWKRNPMGEFEDIPIDRNDHAMNTIKYMLSFRPKPGQIIKPISEQVPAWMFWHEVGDKKYETKRAF